MPFSLDAALRIASTQHGAVSSAQAIGAGSSHSTLSRAARAGLLDRVGHGVYIAAGSAPTWKRDLSVAVLSAGPDAAASHRAAIALRCPETAPPPRLDVTTARPHRAGQADPLIHRTRRLSPNDTSIVDGIMTVSLPRALFDISAHEAVDDVVDAIDIARKSTGLGIGSLLTCLDRYRGRGWSGTTNFETAIASLGSTIPDSAFERMMADFLVHHQIAEPTMHFALRIEGVIMAVDFCWPEHRVVLELDGWHHRTARQIKVDARRDRRLADQGYRVIRLTWNEWVTQRYELLATLDQLGLRLRAA